MTGIYAKGERLPSPEKLELCEGARVMFTQNDISRKWVNGSLGIVSGIDNNSIRVDLEKNGYVHQGMPVERSSWQQSQFLGYDKNGEIISKRNW